MEARSANVSTRSRRSDPATLEYTNVAQPILWTHARRVLIIHHHVHAYARNS